MDAWLCGVFDGLIGAVDIFEICAGQAADHCVLRAARNFRNSVEVAFRSDGKARFDNVYAHIVKQFGDFELFFVGHGCAGRLLAVTQSCVKNEDAV